MFKLLSRGAYAHAGLQLVEALREYEQLLARRPVQEDDYARLFARNRSEFSWRQILEQFCSDPLTGPCLHRANWADARPDLYVSTYVTERDNLVIDVRPCMDTGFKYGGITHLRDHGDFYRFPIVSAGWEQPTNRVLHIGLGAVASSFSSDEPWVNYRHPGAQHAFERRLILLAAQAKLHQLSLYFDCFVSTELVEFGPERYIDFRKPNGTQDPRHKFKSVFPINRYNYLNPDCWAPPRIQAHMANASLDVQDLYKFATDYLSGLDSNDQVQTLGEYLTAPPSRPITRADVDELLQCATDEAYRASSLLSELAIDATFTANIKDGHHQFSSFCQSFNLSEQSGLEWLVQHHPDALAHVGYLSIPSLITYLRSHSGDTAAAPGTEQVDRLLAERLAGNDSFRWRSVNELSKFLDNEAADHGFSSFDAFLLWAEQSAQITWAASVARAERVAEHAAACQVKAAASRKAAAEKRKATMAARKAAAEGKTA